MDNLVHSPTGLIHLIASMLSLLSGTLVLLTSKGTRRHKTLGYIYGIFMLIVNVTSFGLYHLFDGLGPFHFAALVSLVTLLSGMIPVLLRTKSWLSLHLSFMYYSVIGLYAAFLSEIIVRISAFSFGPAVGITTTMVMIIAMILFRFLSIKWTNQFTSHVAINKQP